MVQFMIIISTACMLVCWSTSQLIFTFKENEMTFNISRTIGGCAREYVPNTKDRQIMYDDIHNYQYPNYRLNNQYSGCVAYCVLIKLGFYKEANISTTEEKHYYFDQSQTLEHSKEVFKNIMLATDATTEAAEKLTDGVEKCFPAVVNNDLSRNCQICLASANCYKEHLENMMFDRK